MSAYYNEWEPYAAQWLRNLISAGHIAPGDVDERSIVDVRADDLRGYTQIHLFAGIGGFAYACRLAGWPDERPILTGGFPCQDISTAGHGVGIEAGVKSGLWREMHRLICDLRPRLVIVENSSAILSRGLSTVLGDLAAGGYDAEWDCLSASEFGAPHERERFYLLAYPNLQHGQTGLGVFPYRTAEILKAHHRYSNSVWLQATIPPPGLDDGLSLGMVRRSTTEGFGNAIVPQVAAEFIRAAAEAMT